MTLSDRAAATVIRIAHESELPAVLEIARESPWEKSAYLTRQVHYGNVIVAVDSVAIRGFVAWNREFFSLPFIWLVVVSKPFRGQGIASALFAFVESQCAASRLYSSTNQSDTLMQRFFERRGYHRAGTAEVDPGDPEFFYRIDP